jgi:hypothetical protein
MAVYDLPNPPNIVEVNRSNPTFCVIVSRTKANGNGIYFDEFHFLISRELQIRIKGLKTNLSLSAEL